MTLSNKVQLVRYPIFDTEPQFKNISINAKKPAEISLGLKVDNPLLFVSNRSTKREVLGYQDLDTGLFITESKDSRHPVYPFDKFKSYASKLAAKFVCDFLDDMQLLMQENQEDYNTKYKPVEQLSKELFRYLEKKVDFYRDLQKQLDVVTPRPLPVVNEYLKFKDDKIMMNQFITADIPYLNPKHQTLTDEQKQVVDKFLDVFLDEYNKKKLSWYFGAILSNVDMKDANISKALIVTSNTGGTGKSTLINSLGKGLITDPYLQIESGFDNHFIKNDKFATSSLLPCRLTIFSEAYFNGIFSDNDHNFSGLDDSAIKTWITEGIIPFEKKYEQRKIIKLYGMGIILTNYPPYIPPEKKELARRFMSVVIKSSDMVTSKALQLNMSEKDIYQYIKDNAQAFANYFVTFYQINPTRYQSLLYSNKDVNDDLEQLDNEEQENQKQQNLELKQQDAISVIESLCNKYHLDSQKLIMLIEQSKSHKLDDIRFDDNYLYINASRNFFKSLDMLPLRTELIDIYGRPIVKYHSRMIKIPNK